MTNKYKRCIICRYLNVPGQTVRTSTSRGGKYVLCKHCRKKWIYNKGKDYIRSRALKSRYKHQDQLRQVVSNVLHEHYDLDVKRVYSELGFPMWGMSKKGGLLRYDMGVISLKLLVEYHGEQHYHVGGKYTKTKRALEESRRRDYERERLARKNGWNYVVFTYRDDVGNRMQVEQRLKVGGAL